MKVNHSKIILIVSLLFFLGGLAVVGGFGYYIDYRASEFLAQLQMVADQRAMENEREQTLTLLAASADDRAELEGYVLKGNEGTVAFLSEMDRLAAELGLDLATNRLDVEKTGGTFDTLHVAFTAEGSTESVDTFVLLLETMPYVSRMTDLTLHYNTDAAEFEASAQIGLAISIVSS